MTIAPLRIGTRASQLAQWQAHWVAQRLGQQGIGAELVEISTTGDRQQSDPIAELGQPGVFTKEIQAAVLDGRVDVAVHSLKDLPTETTAGLTLAAVPSRAVASDALVTRLASTLAGLPRGARVGTGSVRRHAQLQHLRADLQIVPIRGNVDTRLRKLDEGEYDALILAAAGLMRLGLDDRITELLEPPRMLPAAGQGALGIECRDQDATVRESLAQLDDDSSRQTTASERAMLARLHGGCSAPVGAWGRLECGRLVLDGLVANPAGTQVLRASATGSLAAAISVGQEVAEQLLSQGAAEIIGATR
ncbi:MAG: hydroxymethylbilane synthase [Pirellulales bacterium]|nr:hydroxymethylbilane synthase [Pirellulales bacterium]